MGTPWIAYSDLAWTEDWLVDPAGLESEVEVYLSLIRQHSRRDVETLLHLGCGAGGHDRLFKRHFSVTGVDVSPGMLAMARAAHPDIEYIEGDMQTLRLDGRFDAVAIPDSIDYMVSLDDLRAAIRTATRHLRPGGVLLVTGKTAETFQENNFAYTGDGDGIHVTLLENNFVPPLTPDRYEATLVYLIRERGELEVHVDRHVLGLFPRATWEQVFREQGLVPGQHALDDAYDEYLLGGGTYPMHVFIGIEEGPE
jgi:SAM-dependent methyltransferase